MNSKNIIILVLIALVLGGGAIITSRKEAPKSNPIRGKHILNQANLDAISKISIKSKSGKTSTLTKTDKGWVVLEENSYPANFDKLRRSIISISKAKIENAISVTDKQKKEMNIGASSPTVTLTDTKNKTLLKLTLGDMREITSSTPSPYGSRPTGRFVSTDGGKSVLVVSETFYNFSNSSPKNWLNTDLCSVSPNMIDSVSITAPGQEPIKISRDKKSNKLAVEKIKKGKEVVTEKLSSIENALNYTRFDDLATTKLTDKELGFNNPHLFEAVTTNNIKYRLTIGNKVSGSENRYAKLDVSYVGEISTNNETNTQANVSRIKADNINKKTSGWTYIIPSYKLKSLIIKNEDLFKDIPKKKVEKKEQKKTPEIKPIGESKISTSNSTTTTKIKVKPQPTNKTTETK